ncbi:MAG: hypothetical protein ACYDAL_14125 [Candidatus Dormibacteraceae bacterium]
MTTATAPKTREQELEEQIAQHRKDIAKIEAKADELDAAARECDVKVDAMVSDLKRPTEGMAEDLIALRSTAAQRHEAAALLRRRVESAIEQSGIRHLEVELNGLQTDRLQAEQLAATKVRHAANLAEYIARIQVLENLRVQLELEFGRCHSLRVELIQAARQHGLDTPANFDSWMFGTGRVDERIAAWPRANDGASTWHVADQSALTPIGK